MGKLPDISNALYPSEGVRMGDGFA